MCSRCCSLARSASCISVGCCSASLFCVDGIDSVVWRALGSAPLLRASVRTCVCVCVCVCFQHKILYKARPIPALQVRVSRRHQMHCKNEKEKVNVNYFMQQRMHQCRRQVVREQATMDSCKKLKKREKHMFFLPHAVVHAPAQASGGQGASDHGWRA